MRKTSIFEHFGPKWPFLDSFLPKWAKRDFFKKALGKFFSPLQVLTNCKVSEKSNERFSRNCVTNGRTNERTNGRDSLGFQRLRRETKKHWNLTKFSSRLVFTHYIFAQPLSSSFYIFWIFHPLTAKKCNFDNFKQIWDFSPKKLFSKIV